jgi:hypothetical protein
MNYFFDIKATSAWSRMLSRTSARRWDRRSGRNELSPGDLMPLALVVLAVPVVALLAAVWLPFVNGPHLWFGMPSLLVWSVLWVLALTPALAFVERCRNRAGAEEVN